MRSTEYPETPYFVPNGADQTETAVLLVGTAKEHGLSQRSVRATTGGFWISQDLTDLVFGEAEAEPEPEPEPEAEPEAEAEAKPKTTRKRSSSKKTSGNRAAKTSTPEKE